MEGFGRGRVGLCAVEIWLRNVKEKVGKKCFKFSEPGREEIKGRRVLSRRSRYFLVYYG